MSHLSSPVLITGAGGMLATDLEQTFKQALGEKAVICLPREELDITNPLSIETAFKKYQPKVVMNGAAYTAVDKAESERELCSQINFKGPQLLAQACAKTSAFLVHFSTDQVFDGTKKHPQTEEDPTHPLNWYAQTKFDGEQAVLKYPNSLVLRVQWLYGRSKDRFSILKQKETFPTFVDQWGAPTWTQEIANDLIVLLKHGHRGLFNYSYDDYGTWADIFRFVKSTWSLNVQLEPKQTASLNLPAKRPEFSVMDNRKISSALGRKMGSWQKPLEAFLRASHG